MSFEQPAEKVKRSAAEYSKAYRKRMKDDPDLYNTFREHEILRVKLYMSQLCEEKTKKFREATKIE